MARWSSLYRYGAKGRGMQAVARRASATIPAMRLEEAVRAVPSVSQNNRPAPSASSAQLQDANPAIRAGLQNMNPELGYAERDRVISKISLAATLHQADQATISYLGHFSKTLVESLGEDAKPVLPIFQELLAVKELRSRYLERRRSLLEQKQAAESSTRHLKAAIADLEGLEEASSQEQPPEEGKMPQTLAKNILGLDHPTPPSVPPSYNGPSVVGGLVGLKQRMKMRYESQVRSGRRCHPARARRRAPFTTHALYPPTYATHSPCPLPPHPIPIPSLPPRSHTPTPLRDPHSHPPSPRLLAYPRARSFQVYALQEESFRAHALLREIDGDGPSRAVEAVVAAKEATLLKELVSPNPITLTLTLP